jgi:hypothetical protein
MIRGGKATRNLGYRPAAAPMIPLYERGSKFRQSLLVIGREPSSYTARWSIPVQEGGHRCGDRREGVHRSWSGLRSAPV